MGTVNDYTNELILKYDENFNELYNKKVNIDTSITNKEAIINKTNDEIFIKEQHIIILKNLSIYLIIIAALIILSVFGKISMRNVIIITVVLFIVFAIYIYYTIYNHFTINQAGKVLYGAKIKMKEYTESIFGKTVPQYTCPSDCTTLVGPEDEDIQTYSTPTLNIDPQNNVWKYGDMPNDLFTSPKTPGSNFYPSTTIPNYQNSENEPKSSFGTSYPNTTYYQCSWMGGNESKSNSGYGMPMIDSNTYSTIPCTYKPNYTETARYICSGDPNKNGFDMSKCDKI